MIDLTILAAMALAQATSSDVSSPTLQKPPTQEGKAEQDEKKDEKQDEKKEKTEAEKQKEAYDKAVKDYTSSDGVFKVWQKDESVFFELDDEVFGRDFLISSEYAATPTGMYNGTSAGESVIRFEKKGDKVLLRQIRHNVLATEGKEIQKAVAQSNVAPIIHVFKLKAKNEKNHPVIDVSSFLKSPPAGVFRGPGSVDSSKSFLESVKVFPENITVETLATYRGGGGGFGGFGGPPPGASTYRVFHTILLLPEDKMKPRLYDSRLGYFSKSYQDFGTGKHGVENYRYITKYRLEKKNPKAAMSDPIKPIVYYIAPEVPKEWHQAMIDGVEDWNVAFEQAGFTNAIQARLAPTPEEDPDWSPEDVRYSVIRWAPLPIANAMGPHVGDPRTGEIISAHIIMWHDVLKLGVDWYYSQASPMDPRAQRIPFPKDLMDDIVRFIVSHEVGHTLGLQHNGKSSAMVPTELLRDKKWTHENGTATSIMDYARFNYVAQPGDGANLMAKIGVYDKFAIEWGYTPIDHAQKPEDERSVLDAWASRQVGNPMLRFGNFSSVDPTGQSEALGADSMTASTYGLENLKRVMKNLQSASNKFGRDYSELSRFYGAVWSQYNMYASHVVANVGGIEKIDYHAGRGGEVNRHVSKDKQKRAVKYLMDNVLTTPEYLLDRSILMRIGTANGSSRVYSAQSRAINSLLSSSRTIRMTENEAINGDKAYTIEEMIGDMHAEVWKELNASKPVVDSYRRTMQRAYLSTLASRAGGSSTNDLKSFALDELIKSEKKISAAAKKAGDTATRVHLQELSRSIKQVLENKNGSSTAGGVSFPFPFIKEPVEDDTHLGCLSHPPTTAHKH